MASGARKFAVSVDRAVLARAEKLRRRTGESRSALVARALRRLLAEESQAARVEEYVTTYRSMPERAGEVAAARTLARRSLAAVDWKTE